MACQEAPRALALVGDFRPDGGHIAFIATDGVRVMRPGGSGLFQLNDLVATGSLSWIGDSGG